MGGFGPPFFWEFTMPNLIDKTWGLTEAKYMGNLEALTGELQVKRILYGSATVDVGTLADGVGSTHSITVNGVALGDIVLGASFGVDVVDMSITAYVQAANTVEVRVQNESAAGTNLASTTVRVLVADVT
jgi:hypothetical protein